MIERFALILALSLAVMATYYLLRAVHVRRMRPAAAGQPSLIYFRGDHCAVCPAQERIINQLATHWEGEIRIERIDAERDPAMAARYSVFSLPTTILVDGDGKVQHINYGLVDSQKLGRQAAELLAGVTRAAGSPSPEKLSTIIRGLRSALRGRPMNMPDKELS